MSSPLEFLRATTKKKHTQNKTTAQQQMNQQKKKIRLHTTFQAKGELKKKRAVRNDQFVYPHIFGFWVE